MTSPSRPPHIDGDVQQSESDIPSIEADRATSAPASARRRVLRIALWTGGALLLIAGVAAYWALDRFVIDDVQISDVAAFEASATPGATADATAITNAATTTDPTTDDASPSAESAAEAGSDAAQIAPTEPVITEDGYISDAATITISKVVTGTGDDTVTSYVADITVDDASSVRAGFAKNQFGQNIIADTSKIAEYYDAVFAINGDYYGFRDTGIVIRNGVAFRDKPARDGLAIYTDGRMEIYDETTTSADELIAAGVWNTMSFGPALVDGGEVLDGIENIEVDTNFGNHSVQGTHPRTGIGMISANHYVFVVVDGRSRGYSRGVTMNEFAEIFRGLGATVAYNLDGGGSATMYFNGELVNNPLGKNRERGTSDIIYIGR